MFVQILFALSAILTVASAVAVAMTRNIMHSCVFLLGSLIGVAGLYVTLGADFIAAVQIMVYVGGVVILMLFAVMLTGGKEFMDYSVSSYHKVPFMGNKTTYIIGSIAAAALFLSIFGIVKNLSSTAVEGVELNEFVSTVDKIGISLLTDHVLVFEISSVLLLGALVGAAIIARPRNHQRSE